MSDKKESGPLGFLVKDAVGGMNNGGQPPDNPENSKESTEKTKEKGFGGSGIRWFSEINHGDVAIAGGKGASLGEMYNNDFPVPPGFIITAQAYDHFIESNGIHDKILDIISKIDMENTRELTKASKEIRKSIENAKFSDSLKEEIFESYEILSSEKIEEMGVNSDALAILKNSQEPIFVSVRSSATAEDLADASFAGQQESFLNVKGNSDLIEHIKRCFSSLYTPRAIYYRDRKGFKEASIAVVVQKMIDSEKSGVVFSREPIRMTEDVFQNSQLFPPI